MRGITIILNNERIHTGDDLDLVQEAKTIGEPDVQSFTAKVPGRNGLLNLTKGLTGKVTYYNRDLSFQYFGSGSMSELLQLEERFFKYHGQTIRIIDDDRPGHYYEGEATVSTQIHGTYITIELKVDAQPFRLKLNPTIYSKTLSGASTIVLANESIGVIPTITVTAATKISFNGVTVDLSAGSYEVESFELQAGNNTFNVSGTGTITFEYREGAI